MRVGIDFDNTIANYEHVFAGAARARGWVPQDFVGTKKQLRDTLRQLDDGEIKWQVLQGEVYGIRIAEAEAYPGFFEFLRAAKPANLDLYIVSHKTRYSNYDPHKVDLREAALGWMEQNKLFDPALGLTSDRVFFEDTRDSKIERLSSLDCDVFIDDLEEVLLHPGFPSDVKRILFTSNSDALVEDDVVACPTWADIRKQVINGAAPASNDADRLAPERLTAIGTRLAKAPLRAVTAARSGGNNRLFRVEADRNVFALKTYFHQAGDNRDRQATEFNGLAFLHRHGVTQVPRPIALEPAEEIALYQWIEGEPVVASPGAIDAALDLVRALESVKGVEDAGALPLASEACLCLKTICDQVEARLGALRAVAGDNPELGAFLQNEVSPAFDRAREPAKRAYEASGLAFDQDLDPELRCLNPSDFGFHNALVDTTGRVVFLDFEYFGWDDPVKLVSDFMLHPGMDLTQAHRQRFLQGASAIYAANPGFQERLRACLPLYALRWTMILLNLYLPEKWRRRVRAGLPGERKEILRIQLNKARVMLARATFPDGEKSA